MKRLVYVCFLALVSFSCSTSDNNEETPFESSNFYALTVGNQWVYKNYKYNMSAEIYDDTGVVDSISIVGTEIVNDHTYYKFRRLTTGNEDGITFCNPNGEHFELLRDSVGYLVRDDGTIKYANSDFSARAVNEQAWGTIYDQLIALDHEITVEAGTFNSTYSQRYAIMSNNEQSAGLDHIYYADGFGLVYDTSSYVTNDIPSIIRRLDSYDILE